MDAPVKILFQNAAGKKWQMFTVYRKIFESNTEKKTKIQKDLSALSGNNYC